MRAYYNENDPKAAAWLRELIKGGHIAHGEVDERSIADVQATDLAGFGQCHFFAGIGGWSYALRLAGWPDDRPVWTGSCPCQPFSVAGKRDGDGQDDERNLFPVWANLIRECRPAKILGEQVTSPAARLWLDRVHAEMEAMGYAFGAAVLPAAGVGAPQGRHRTWFVADADHEGWERRVRDGKSDQAWQEWTIACGEPVRSIGRSWPPGPRAIEQIPLSPDGISNLLGRCRGYGNAIVPQVAAEFVRACQ